MRRRDTFNLLAAASALPCLAMCVVWLCSAHGALSIGNHYTVVSIATDDEVRVTLCRYTFDLHAISHLDSSFVRFSEDHWTPSALVVRGVTTRGHLALLRLDYLGLPSSSAVVLREYRLSLPFWMAAALLGVSGAACALFLRRMGSREQAGHCHQCGYDMRATVRNAELRLSGADEKGAEFYLLAGNNS